MYDPNAKLSAKYKLKDLTQTSQFLTRPNDPQSPQDFNNLVALAQVLEKLTTEVGPFTIISAFRTKELQNILSSQGEPTSKGLSFHELGRAVDVAPTNQSLDSFVGKILARPALKNLFAEIAYKPGQKSVHLSINIPGDTRTTKVLVLGGKSYGTATSEVVARLTAPFKNPFISGGAVVAILGVIALATMKKTRYWLMNELRR